MSELFVHSGITETTTKDGFTLLSAEFKKEMHTSKATLWAKALGDDLYELSFPPPSIPNLNYGDIVQAIKIEGHALASIKEVVKKSGYRTIRLFFFKKVADSEKQMLVKKLDEFEVLYKIMPKNFYVLSIAPEQDYSAICEYLESLKENELIRYDTGVEAGEFLRAWSKEHMLRKPNK